MTGPVERAIRAKIAPGTMTTFAQSKPFVVDSIDSVGIVLLLGAGRWPTRISWDCLEGIADFLRSRGWVDSGGSFSPSDPSSLDGHLKPYVKRASANWVARVLFEADVVDVDRGPPLRVRLNAGY